MSKRTNAIRKEDSLLVKTEKKIEQTLTILWNDIPKWMQDNQFIHGGYRPQSNSFAKSAASLGYLHNESVNIWTHLIGAVMAASAAAFLFFSLRPRFSKASYEDTLVFSCYFVGAMVCLGMSATYHTIANHSPSVAKFGNRLDYMGIVFLIWGSFIPSIYYGFSNDPDLISLYWTMISSIGLGTLVVVLHPKFRTPEWRPFRAFMFVMMGLSAVFPVLHGLHRYGYELLEKRIGLTWLVGQGVLYIIGAAIYAARVPERWRPGAFDIWGSSHQIFHVLVVCAAAAHLVGLLKAFDYEHNLRIGLFGKSSRRASAIFTSLLNKL